MENREKLIDKISKIKRKAEGTDNIAEQEIFLEKMVQLMNQHGISDTELRGQVVTRKIGFTQFDAKYTDRWRIDLMISCGILCGTIPLFKGSVFLIYGQDQNCEATIEAYNWIHDQIRKIARSLYPHDRSKYRKAQHGLQIGVSGKISDIMEKMGKGPDGKTDSKLPMVLEHENVQSYLDENVSFTIRKDRDIKVDSAMVTGYNNADQVQVRKASVK
jgi:hypothetical protein